MAIHLELFLAALFLFSAFMLLMQRRIIAMIYTFAWQSALLTSAILVTAVVQQNFALYLSAILTAVLKIIFIPWFLRYLAVNFKANINYEPTALINKPFWLALIAVSLIVFSYHLMNSLPYMSSLLNSNLLSIALAAMLLGMLLIITHRKALSHAIGFMVMENGIFFAALLATSGMPLVVELGVAFDVLVAVILFAVFFFHLSDSIDSLDVDQLNKLREG